MGILSSHTASISPFNRTHGTLFDMYRHVGDLGNIVADPNGSVNATITDPLIMLNGPISVLGRSVVVSADPDDLGRGNT